MPPPANIALLLGLLGHHGDFGELRVSREESIDIDRAESLGQRYMVALAQRLVAKKRQPMTCEKTPHIIGNGIAHFAQIDIRDLDPASIHNCRLHRRLEENPSLSAGH